jgi:two-component system, chemotaxis family, CheB/CheR fusion protein
MLDGVRVLFVDDCADEAEMYRLGLERLSADVVCAESVDEALATIASAPFDVVVSDVFMHDRSGLELARELRAAGVTTPAVALTGADKRLIGEETREAGFDEHCVKPCTPTELAVVLSRLVAESRMSGSVAMETCLRAREAVRRSQELRQTIRDERAQRRRDGSDGR